MDLRVQMNTGRNRDISELAHDSSPEPSRHPRMFRSGVSSEADWIPAKACGNHAVRIHHCEANCAELSRGDLLIA